MKQFFTAHKKNPWFWIFLFIGLVSLFLIPTLSMDAGNSGDEDGFQIPHGQNIIRYYESKGQDTTYKDFKNLKYYGSSPDVIAAFVNDTFQIEDINISRHIINSLFGWLAILMVGLIAYSLAGWRAAVFSMLFLLLSPRFLGHAFNNTKDAPFAAAVIAAIYFMILFFKQFPKVKWYVVLLFILSIALAISIRVGGLILFGYFGLFGFCYLIKTYIENSRRLKLEKRKNIGFTDKLPMNYIWRMLIFGIGICVVGFFAGLLIWPYAMEAPFAHTMESFKEMSAFATAIRQVFEGTMQWSDFLPWYYTPKYILITIPVAVILGFLLYPFFGGCKKQNLFFTCLIYFTCIFPVFWIVYTNANVYGGWRHAMFAYPPMVVAAGLGFDAVIRRVEIKWGGARRNWNQEEYPYQRHFHSGHSAAFVESDSTYYQKPSLRVCLFQRIGGWHQEAVGTI